jgi:predicted O-methyltransferase YrrM
MQPEADSPSFKRRCRSVLKRHVVLTAAKRPLALRSSASLAREAIVGHGALQKTSELASFLNLLRRRHPRVVVEIGTASGGAFHAFCQVASDNALLVSIDLPGGEFGGGYDEDGALRMRSFARKGQSLHFLRCDSHERSAKERLLGILSDLPVDLLFIDGDHTYKGVREDFEMYSPLVRSGGLVVFHDIVEGPPDAVGGVPRFWKEIKRRGEVQEIVENWAQGGCGIGVAVRP